MRRLVFVSLIIMALVLAACGGGATPEPTATPAPAPVEPTATAAPAPAEPTATAAPAPTETQPTPEPVAEVEAMMLPEVNPLEVTGDIIAAGSSTVFPLAEAVAELFIDEGYGGNITIDSIGTGAGFERFCTAGESDIANASRAIKDTEVANCAALSPARTPIEFRIGTDALAVVVNPANDWIGEEGLTKEQLAKLFSSETTNWSDVDPAWPAEPVKRFSPGTDSGTFDYFVEAVMDPVFVVDKEADKGKGEEQLLGAANLQLSEDDNVLVQGVSGDPYAIGYFGFAYFEENAATLRDLAIEGVAPDMETVEGGAYPLARPLFMYSDAGVMTSKPQVAAFLNFVLSNVDDVISEVGYFPASTEALNASKQAWMDATGGVLPEAPAEAASGGNVLPEVNPLEVTGDIIAAGSSTVFPLAEAVAELFIDEGYGGNITIDSIGTGAGFERFCTAGESDIANASRPIRDTEIANCAALSPARTPIEFRIGTDALAVVVNPDNDWVGEEGVTIEELAKLFSSETTNWSDVNPAWPAEPVKRFSPGTDSGTFDYFVEAVMDEIFPEQGEAQILGAANLQLSEDDNVLVQGVSGDPYAIGYFGFAYFEENAATLRDLAIEGVMPTAETVDAGEYALARPLFLYSDAEVMNSKPQVAAFLNFVLSNVDDVITEVGYFPASTEAINASKQAWMDAVGQ